MAGLSGSGPSNHHLPFAVFHGINNPPPISFINQEGSGLDFGELEQAIVLQGIKINSNNNETKSPALFTASTRSTAATLDMFPSWPIRFHHPPRRSSKSGGESTDSGSAVNNNTLSTKPEVHVEPESPMSSRKASSSSDHHHHHHHQAHQQLEMASDHGRLSNTQPAAGPATQALEKRKGPGSSSTKVLDAKTLRRLAQNREAARKSRLRKKAYVQQLESSRIKLAQLEQDLQRARAQGLLIGGGGAGGNISSGAAIFDMEYSRWLEDDHRHISELRTGLQAHLPDGDLRRVLDGYIAHYDEIFQLKGAAARSDVFHLITGMWTTPAERCFLWMGGFKPSELIKMLINQLDPLTEQQIMGICSLQHSSQQAEEALSQGLDQLQQSLIDTIASVSIDDGMHHMAIALGKIANLEGFVRQADNLRQQTLHQLCRTLTVRQAARCFLVIGEYYGRLRALSSLWTSRPRETMIVDDHPSSQAAMELQMMQSAAQNHFSSF